MTILTAHRDSDEMQWDCLVVKNVVAIPAVVLNEQQVEHPLII